MNQSTFDRSRLNISTYTNYIVNNHVRENIELKNEVKIKGLLFNKNRYAILTTHRFLIFENRERYLNKKKPDKNFPIYDYEFTVDSNVLKIQKDSKIVKEYIFPSIEIAIHWWESINELKRAPKIENDDTFLNSTDLRNSVGNNTAFLPKSNNIFTRSVIDDLNSSAFFGQDGDKDKSVTEKENDKKELKNSMSTFCLSFKPKKNKVGFKENLEKKYIINDKYKLEEINVIKRNSLVTQKEDSFISGISKQDESYSDLSDICIPKMDDNSQNSKTNNINNISELKTKRKYTMTSSINNLKQKKINSNNGSMLHETSFSETIGGYKNNFSNSILNKSPSFTILKEQGNINNLSIIPRSKSFSSFSSVSNEKKINDNFKLDNIHTFNSKIQIKESAVFVPPIKLSSNPDNHNRKKYLLDNSGLYNDNNKLRKKQNENTADKKHKTNLIKSTIIKKNNSRNILRKSKNENMSKTMIRVLDENDNNLEGNYNTSSIIMDSSNTKKTNHNKLTESSSTTKLKKSYYFLEKSFKNSANNSLLMENSYQLMPNNTTEKMKPSTLIEQLLQNRYSKTMLRLSLREKKENTTFIPKLHDSLDFIMKNPGTNLKVLKILYEKMPNLLRNRLNQKDLMLLSKNKGFFGLRPTDPIHEIKNIISRDIDALIKMFNELSKIIPKKEISADFISKKSKFEKEMSKIKEDLMFLS